MLAKSEQKGEDMVDVMEYVQQYVPKAGNGDFFPLLFGGDQPTRERACHAQDTKLQSSLPLRRLLSLIPKVEVWHIRVLFNQVLKKNTCISKINMFFCLLLPGDFQLTVQEKLSG